MTSTDPRSLSGGQVLLTMQVGGVEQAAGVLAGTVAPTRASSWEPEDLVAAAAQGVRGGH